MQNAIKLFYSYCRGMSSSFCCWHVARFRDVSTESAQSEGFPVFQCMAVSMKQYAQMPVHIRQKILSLRHRDILSSDKKRKWKKYAVLKKGRYDFARAFFAPVFCCRWESTRIRRPSVCTRQQTEGRNIGSRYSLLTDTSRCILELCVIFRQDRVSSLLP